MIPTVPLLGLHLSCFLHAANSGESGKREIHLCRAFQVTEDQQTRAYTI